MKKLFVAIGLLASFTYSCAVPVVVNVRYKNIASINAKNVSTAQCKELIKSGKFIFDSKQSIHFIAASKAHVTSSKTIFDKVVGGQRIILKYGHVSLKLPENSVNTKRLSLVIKNTGNSSGSSGAIVYENYCAADFDATSEK